MPFPRIYSFRHFSGPVAPGDNWIAADFVFNTPSPFMCFTIPTGYRILTARIDITVPFNDAGSLLKVGTLAQADKYMADTQNVPQIIGENETKPYDLLVAPTDIYLTITPAAATAGRGVVLIEFDRPFP
jgi:hypothetical protein